MRSKCPPTRPEVKSTPQAQPLGYVEDVVEPRTKLEGIFSALLEVPGAACLIRIRHNGAFFIGIFF